MLNNKTITVVLPAYNAAKTLRTTYAEIPHNIVDNIILVDDCSTDETIHIAKELGIKNIIKHENNLGYGGNQKSCYKKALELQSDIIIMLHPDYQYTPKLIPAMASMLSSDIYDCVLASRILGKGAIEGGMPKYKYFFNRVLTFAQNLLVSQKLSEYHTGYRAYASDLLVNIDYENNSNDFIFDNEILVQIIASGARIGEISCPTRYDQDSSSINLYSSIKYGLGVLQISIIYFLYRSGILNHRKYNTYLNNRKQ